MAAELVETFNLGDLVYEIYNDKPDFELLELKQIHSNIVISGCEWKEGAQADGVIANLNELTPLAIRTADCLPIALIGNSSVANIHAGWRGLHQKILHSQALSNINPHTAIIGPHISEKSYEVGPEFKDHFQSHVSQRDDSLFLNLSMVAKEQIHDYFGPIKTIISKECTYQNAKLNSFRLNKTDKRNYNILRLK